MLVMSYKFRHLSVSKIKKKAVYVKKEKKVIK